jgi:hypothetical protein
MKLPKEALVETGGGRFGRNSWFGMNYSWPFVYLRVDNNGIAISNLFRSYHIMNSEIEDVQPYNGFFSEGIQFIHTNTHIPPFIVFWTNRRDFWLAHFRESLDRRKKE